MRTLVRLALVSASVFAFVSSAAPQNVSYERLLNADRTPQDWLMYGGNFASQRYSRLKQIDRTNVQNLKAAWIYQPAQPGMIEASPVVVDGIMYVTEPPSTVTALDAKYGTKIWSWTPVLPQRVYTIGMHLANRGIAILDSTIYVGTIDAHLVALDAKTGAVKWNVHIAENNKGYAIESVPRIVNGKVIIGIGGGEAAARGFLDAYDAKTGARVWRLWTVPAPGEPGSETWGKDMTGTGGATTWLTGSYDPELNLLYWGTGNPGPDYNRDARPGDNLYSCSLLAIDPDNGQLKWYFQYTPHDTHDWDSSQAPVLFDDTLDGKPRKFVAMANRNGFYYVLDRVTGQFVAGRPFVKVTWAKGLDEKGRPILADNIEPTSAGQLVYPAVMGGTEWTGPSYSPETKLFYVSAHEMGAYFKAGRPRIDVNAPPNYGGGGQSALSGDDAYGAIRALDSLTGKLKWEYRLLAPAWVSTLATAGGLVFSGSDEGDFFALDAATGKLLWEFKISGTNPRTNPITYAVDGKQYVITESGNNFIAFSLP